jgi:hypothetical protein
MGAASFKSLYPKRPSEITQMRTTVAGAPDTALRLDGTYRPSVRLSVINVTSRRESSDLEFAEASPF